MTRTSSVDSTTLAVDDPFTEETAFTVELADDRTIGATLDRAKAAAKSWRTSSLADRKAVCVRALEAFEADTARMAEEISRMMGKPLAQAKGEVGGTAGRWRHMIEICDESLADIVLPPKEGHERRIAKVPLGVVVDFPAWNYPLLTAVNAVVPAILAGNSVVVKHSPRSPLCGQHFARAFEKAGAPAHLVQSLDCDHAASERMVADPRVDHVLFTGSVLGGHRIQEAASKRFIGVGLELGGNDPAYVAEDSDVEKAAASLVDGAIYNAGQSCCAVERIYVHTSKYDAFVAACEPLVRAYVMGDPRDEKTTLGPIAQPNHVSELEALTADAVRKGAKLIVGGSRARVNGKGRFFEATLLAGMSHDMNLFNGESFGPIVAVMPVASDDEALSRMNDSGLGLTAAIFTADRERAARLAGSLEAGTVYMNKCDALDPALPWSGCKDSGRGVTLSALGFDHLTRPKAIHFRLAL